MGKKATHQPMTRLAKARLLTMSRTEGLSSSMPPTRSRQVRCKCKSHCTVFNPITRRYEGDGELVSRSTRDNHTNDDRMSERVLLAENAQAQLQGRRPEEPDWIGLINAEVDLLMTFAVTSPNRRLIFRNNPAEHGPFIWPSEEDIALPNYGFHSLTQDQVNRQMLFVENRLCQLIDIVRSRGHIDENERARALVDRLFAELGRLTRQKEIEWAQQRGHASPDRIYFNTEIFFRHSASPPMPATVAILLSLVLGYIYFLPRRGLRALLGGLKSFLRASSVSPAIVASIPTDPRPGAQRFSLDPITRKFISCSSCHALYPLEQDNVPLTCVNRRSPESPICHAPLFETHRNRNGDVLQIPVRKYVHQDLKSWVGRLLCRPGMETLLDHSYAEQPSDGQYPEVDDIWRTYLFRNLKDATGQPFLPGQNSEGRLVFGLSVDSFNPFYNKTAKQSSSSTGIWLVLLNLPPHLRYLEENLFLAGVIPGHEKPSKEDIYPYINLIIADLLEFWNHGVFFSRTHTAPLGRLFKAMLVPLICDMLAARQVVGLGSVTSHNFCTFCDLDIDDIDVLDKSEWPQKDPTHIRRIAQLWRDAMSEDQRRSIFEAYGIRWSPLHDLPYWNAVSYTIIDSMHVLDLNLLQNHCRSIFQINTETSGGDGFSGPTIDGRSRLSKQAAKAYEKCAQQIRRNNANLREELLVHPRSTLYQVCVDNNILGPNHTLVVGTKWVLANNIVTWRQRVAEQDVEAIATSPPLEEPRAEDEPPGPIAGPSGLASRELTTSGNFDMAQISRVVRNLLDKDEQEESRDKAYNQGSSAIFVFIADTVGVNHIDIDKTKRTAKRELFDRLLEQIDDDEIYEALEAMLPQSEPVDNRAVLGKDIMAAVWSDMRLTVLPAWITPPPSDWGTTRRGKLSADHWRIICTVHLPITLIRLWHDGSPRKKQLLEHYMHLVTAVRIGNMRTISVEHIQAYNFHMNKYVQDIRNLYPDQHLRPTHHAALHIGDMLGLFGPNHSHSSPYYERYINMLHHINTNSKIGELEATFLQTSARRANLRARLTDDVTLRRSIEELLQVMNTIQLEDARGFRLASLLDPNSPTFTPRARSDVAVPLSATEQTLLRHCLRNLSANVEGPVQVATLLGEVGLRGVRYGISPGRNCYILFKDLDSSGSPPLAGIITKIFCYSYAPATGGAETEGVFMTVQELSPVQDTFDPYKSFSPFAGFLCTEQPSQLRVISSAQLISHFAPTRLVDPLFPNMIHVMPLDRVGTHFPSYVTEAG